LGILIALAFLSAILKSPRFIGWCGEMEVRKRLTRLNKEAYVSLHDVLLENDGDLTQIDHIVLSVYGIFVIETKAYKGWIFGSEKGRTWTQTIYKKKSKFQNPLHQNHKHLKFLEDMIGIPMEAMQSVVVFTGDCTFKTAMPDNVMESRNLLSYMRSFNEEIIASEDVAELVRRIEAADCSRDKVKRRQHLREMRLRKSK
jgi:restriction system protein